MKTRKIPALQGIRAIATIGIFLFHAGVPLGGAFPVTLFFMLSGFMLYYTKHGLKEYSSYSEWVKVYVLRKVKEFYPLHILTFIGALFIGNAFQQGKVAAILNILLIHPFIEKYAFTYNGLCWFLAVTFFLYFIGYFLIKLINKIQVNERIIIIIVWVLIYGLNIYNTIGGTLYLYSNPFYRVLDFILGMLIAKVYIKGRYVIRNANALEISIVVLFVVQFVISHAIDYDSGTGYYSILFTFALLAFANGKGVVSQILSAKFFDCIAVYSFEFYMIHELMLRIFRKVFSEMEYSYIIRCLVIAIPALIFSILLTVIYKKISNRFIRKG